MVEGPHRLLHRRVRVRPVREEHVDVAHAEPRERRVERLDDVLAREARVVGAGPAPEHLGREHERRARPAELAEGLAHDFLGLAVAVDLIMEEEVLNREGRKEKQFFSSFS